MITYASDKELYLGISKWIETDRNLEGSVLGILPPSIHLSMPIWIEIGIANVTASGYRAILAAPWYLNYNSYG